MSIIKFSSVHDAQAEKHGKQASRTGGRLHGSFGVYPCHEKQGNRGAIPLKKNTLVITAIKLPY